MESFFIALVFIALVSDRLQQTQRRCGIIGGVVAAIVLRVVMPFFAVVLLKLAEYNMRKLEARNAA